MIDSYSCWTPSGPAPSVIKHTQGILIVGGEDEFSKENDEWDIRIVGKDKDTITLQVSLKTHRKKMR